MVPPETLTGPGPSALARRPTPRANSPGSAPANADLTGPAPSTANPAGLAPPSANPSGYAPSAANLAFTASPVNSDVSPPSSPGAESVSDRALGMSMGPEDEDDDGRSVVAPSEPESRDSAAGTAETAVLVIVSAIGDFAHVATTGQAELPFPELSGGTRKALTDAGLAECRSRLGRTDVHCYLAGSLSSAATGLDGPMSVVVAPFCVPPMLPMASGLSWRPTGKRNPELSAAAVACVSLALAQSRSFLPSAAPRRVLVDGSNVGARLPALLAPPPRPSVPVSDETRDRLERINRIDAQLKEALRKGAASDPSFEEWIDRVGAVPPLRLPDQTVGDPNADLYDI